MSEAVRRRHHTPLHMIIIAQIFVHKTEDDTLLNNGGKALK